MDILVIAPRFPWPLEKGDKLRLYQIIRHLADHGRVHLFALTHHAVPNDHLDQVTPYCASWRLHRIPRTRLLWNLGSGILRGLPASVAWFTDRHALRELERYHEVCKPQVTFGQLARIGEYLCSLPGAKVIDLMDAFSVISAQRSAASSWPISMFFHLESLLLARYERKMRQCTDRQVLISQRDREAVDPLHEWPVTIVPNGIDLDHFHLDRTGIARNDIVFVGNLGYFPNIEAARFLVKEVMPLVWQKRPGTTVLLAGARPSSSVRSLAGRNVTVKAWLPDIREAYADGLIFAAPVFSGAGLQNKILEAMAMELPVVTTNHVNRAIGAAADQEISIADTASEFAFALLKLIEQEGLRHSLARSGHIFVSSKFSWKENTLQLVNKALYPAIDARNHP